MIPLKLSIKGLYSYKEEQIIDFEKLTAAGMFGIFGAVGSGKSSILEAILLALYGSTERLSDRGEKNSMVNLQSNHLLINFEFSAGKNNSQHFLARYSVKRNAKNFNEIKPAEHTFYLIEGGETTPIQQNAEAIIGMKKEHFKQTVIIPQGKFREFIDLTPGPRAEMMKELFGLERFDLSAKTGGLLKVVKNELIRLETQLEGLGDTSEEILKEKFKLREEFKEAGKKASENLDKTSLQLQSLEALKKKHLQFIDFQSKWDALQSRTQEMEEKKKELKAYTQANNYLRPIWNQIKDCQLELEKASTGIVNCNRFKEAYSDDIRKLELQERELREKAEKRPLREAKIRDLKKVLELQVIIKDLEDAKNKVSSIKPSLIENQGKLAAIEKQLSSLEEELDNSRSQATSTQLAKLTGDIKDWSNLSENKNNLELSLAQINKEIQSIKEREEEITSGIPSQFENLDSWYNWENEQLKSLEAGKEQLIENKALQAHVKSLKTGEPCPLCGSVHHPMPLSTDETEEKVAEFKQRLIASKQTIDKIQKLSRQLYDQNLQKTNQVKLYTEKEQDLKTLNIEFSSLKNDLMADGLKDLDALKERFKKLKGQIEKEESLQKSAREYRKQLESLRLQIENGQQQLKVGEQQTIELTSRLKAKEEEISDKNFSNGYMQSSTETIKQTIATVLKDIEDTANLLDGKQKVLKDKRNDETTNLANLENFKNNKEEAVLKLETLNSKYDELKTKLGQTDQKLLDKLFNSNLDEEKFDREIREYEKECSIVQSHLSSLEAEEGVKNFDQAHFNLLQEEFDSKKAELDAINKKTINLDRDISELKEKLETKKDLAKLLDAMENRATNLKELEQLFKGSGFVKYVSSIYLKELCNTANKRFTQLTKNSLRLEIDANNTFWVVDYLNEGKKRLLKTLSGGQTFQASLCLALALAEKVKSLNQADQSFFFLDEGFGALDRKSLRIVFETLKALRHENRIVGIISHVEELQQEIEVFANIVLDAEKGSQVMYSYQ
ncbi:SbcC/MukB-like Walker B domain-containing protein [Cyclobacterium amurskyense]|uniref:SMC domain protein n=1 Tax=Cyclobacterium amurskyense TaxID=320787 RepID=A0A0H4P883_9BACT|nr:SMC family ATPase [Cyclobacterium amurskyense]AKP50384.1 SMC domain protein [Cyclobacterium amurskyense]